MPHNIQTLKTNNFFTVRNVGLFLPSLTVSYIMNNGNYPCQFNIRRLLEICVIVSIIHVYDTTNERFLELCVRKTLTDYLGRIVPMRLRYQSRP